MTVIENIDVVMGAKTADLDKAITKEVKALRQLEKESNKSSGGFGPKGFGLPTGLTAGFAGAAVAAAGVAYEISQISKQLTEIDDTADAAKRLGTSFSDLKVLQLGLGESSGLVAEDINKAIQKMQVGLVDASRDPKGDMARQLSAVGLSPEKLLAGGTLDAFKELSGVIGGMGSQADQLAFASDLFGKNGAALVTSLRDGPEQLSDMADFAEKYGLNLSDAQAEMVGMANDTMGRLSSAMDGAQMQIAAELSPAITVIASDFLGLVGSADDWNSYLTLSVDFLVSAYGTAKDLFNLFTFQGVTNEALTMSIALIDARQVAKDLAVETANKRDAQKQHNALLDQEVSSQKKITDQIEKQINARQEILGSVSDDVAKLRASNQAGLNGESFDDKAFDEKQKLEKLGKTGFDLQLERQQRLRREEEAIAEAIKESADLKERFKDGDQRLVEEIRKLESLKRAGLIDEALFDKAAKEAEESTSPTNQRQGAVSVQQGSVAAYKLLLDRDDELTKTAKSQERISQATLEVLMEARDGINNIKLPKRFR